METKSEIPETTIDSVSHLIERVVSRYSGQDDVLFRGHRDESWKLTPRLGRVDLRFRFDPSIANVEKKMLADFERLAVPHVGAKSLQSEWDVLALAQHHGLPTRLLDWSTNPLFALWFAVERPAEKKKSAAIWAFHPDEGDFADQATRPNEIARTLIFRPRHHDSRIVAQAGWFTAHKYSDKANRFSNFETIAGQRQKLHKFIIPAKNFPAIRNELARCGVNRAVLFPDLAGLCEHITWKYEKLPDEAFYDIASSL